MDPFEKTERKREARHRIRAQRERAGRLKARAVAISLICFALLWGVVFVEMATGNDPVLGDSSSTVAKGSSARNLRAAKAAPAEAEAEAEAVEEEFIEEEPAPVTTSQS
ncbi:MAG: hypothetical protein QOF13_2540 [Solirubrobacterales bacterium]|jgi:hypothetical protein|nr:hypothetical protein [Solirubrobacterales bacterium]